MSSFKNCTSVHLPECPLQGTIYGYYPSLSANSIFLALFVLSAVIFFVQGLIKRKTKMTFFWGVMFIGSLFEGIGYIGRIMLHHNPYGSTGFQLQIVLLIICPAFFAAGIYVCLAKIINIYGTRYSRIKPANLTYIFITCDLISLTLQGAGGGIASGDQPGLGGHIMLAGIVWQVFTLLIFLFLVVEIYIKVIRSSESAKNPNTKSLRNSFKFKGFLWAWAISFIAIFWRCTYRIAELSKGWKSEIMQSEWEFIVFDGCMCLIAVFALNIFHPAWCLVQGEEKYHKKRESGIEPQSEEHRESQVM